MKVPNDACHQDLSDACPQIRPSPLAFAAGILREKRAHTPASMLRTAEGDEPRQSVLPRLAEHSDDTSRAHTSAQSNGAIDT